MYDGPRGRRTGFTLVEMLVVIAVIGAGVDIDHPDLSANIWTNPGEIPSNGVDDDANGQVDDIHGWRFGHDANDNPVESNIVDDDHGLGVLVQQLPLARRQSTSGVEDQHDQITHLQAVAGTADPCGFERFLGRS